MELTDVRASILDRKTAARRIDTIHTRVGKSADCKNRKLSVFRDFKEIRSNLRVKSGIIKDAESDDVISFDIHRRTSG